MNGDGVGVTGKSTSLLETHRPCTRVHFSWPRSAVSAFCFAWLTCLKVSRSIRGHFFFSFFFTTSGFYLEGFVPFGVFSPTSCLASMRITQKLICSHQLKFSEHWLWEIAVVTQKIKYGHKIKFCVVVHSAMTWYTISSQDCFSSS